MHGVSFFNSFFNEILARRIQLRVLVCLCCLAFWFLLCSTCTYMLLELCRLGYCFILIGVFTSLILNLRQSSSLCFFLFFQKFLLNLFLLQEFLFFIAVSLLHHKIQSQTQISKLKMSPCLFILEFLVIIIVINSFIFGEIDHLVVFTRRLLLLLHLHLLLLLFYEINQN